MIGKLKKLIKRPDQEYVNYEVYETLEKQGIEVVNLD